MAVGQLRRRARRRERRLLGVAGFGGPENGTGVFGLGSAARPTGVDDDERQALRAEGLDPDGPAVIAAIDVVRWELSLGT
jgi:hypothetical protein